jgi:serine/threonine-protein kinase
MIAGTNLRVIRPIGEGGMGAVYEVEELSVAKLYVMKVIHAEFARGPRIAARMVKEAKFLARLEHENIVQVFWAGETQDEHKLPYFVMERLTGQTLRELIHASTSEGRPLPLGFAIDVATDLLSALSYAHDNRIVHRDVKPENIFLHKKSSGVVVTKLLDFGILALLSDDARPTSDGFKGTLRYAAPEQIRSEKPTGRTDLYAAGLVLYEMVAGRGPFDDHGTAMAIAAAHLRDPPPPVSQWRSVPAALDQLLSVALSKSPDERPRDGASFIRALASIRAELDGSELAGVAAFPIVRDASDSTIGSQDEGEKPRAALERRRIANSWIDNLSRTLLPDDGPMLRRRGLAVLAAAVVLAGFAAILWRGSRTSPSAAVASGEPAIAASAFMPSSEQASSEIIDSAPLLQAPAAGGSSALPSAAPARSAPIVRGRDGAKKHGDAAGQPPRDPDPAAGAPKIYDPYANP